MPIFSRNQDYTEGYCECPTTTTPGTTTSVTTTCRQTPRLCTIVAAALVGVVVTAAFMFTMCSSSKPATQESQTTLNSTTTSVPSTAAHNKDVPRETYFKISTMFNLLYNNCHHIDWLDHSSLVKESGKLAYFSIRRCKEELNPCPYDSHHSEEMMLVVKPRQNKTVNMKIENEKDNSTIILAVTFEEDKKCGCRNNTFWNKTAGDEKPSNTTVPCVYRVVDTTNNRDLNCNTCSGQ
nr:uncharacterized protein LOC123769562 [Procambarus clarkii]XP_045616756.1 uncharacterized protein LOC123769562 [Procambarus clarkii]